MVDRYWTKEGSKASANVSTSWNTVPDGTGTDALPVAGDTVHFGHPDTLAVNKGTAPCSFDLALNLLAMETYSGYNSSTITSDTIQFVSNNIIQNASNDWLNAGFLVGMEIVVTGASNAANNGIFAIASITGNLLTIGATTLVTEAAGASVTVASDIYVDLAANITLNKLTLNTKLSKSTAGQATITFSGAYLDRESYVFNGDNAVIIDQAKINYAFNSSANGTLAMRFDDGPYPLVTTAGTTFLSPEYMVPTSTNYEGLVTMYSLQVLTGAQFAMGTPTQTAKLNATRTFVVSNTSLFSIAGVLFDAGFSTFAFSVDVDNWVVPVTGDTTYGTAPFFCRFYNLIISTPSTAGLKALIPDTRTLSVNSLTVEGDAILRGQTTTSTNTTSTICSVRRPVIEGSWNFSQLSDGIYVSLMPDTFPITPSYGPAGRVQLSNDGGTFTSDAKFTWTSATSTLLVDGKLTVTGLIDPTGMEFTAVAANPSSANPAKTIWVNSADSDKLYFGASEVGGGGGGGSGTVTSVAVSGSDGLQVDSGSPITTSGTIALGVDKTALLSHINVDDGADVTGTANVTAAGALMDSEVVNLADVKAFDPADYATAAQDGTVTSVATSAPITGGAITGTGTIGISAATTGAAGSMSSADKLKLDGIGAGAQAYTAAANGGIGLSSTAFSLDIDGMNATASTPTNDDLLIIDDGANGTNRKITFTQVESWIQSNVSILKVRDARADGEWLPNDFKDKAVSFTFTDDITGSPNSWDSVMTMKGWSDNYRVWQMWSSATSGSASVDEVPLFFRSGEEDVQAGWGQTKEILTFAGTAPRVDGSVGQVLQTNGAGVLSWATISGPVSVTGEYEKYYLDGTIGTVANGVTTQITFGGAGSSFIPLYNTPVTAWTVAGINTLDILQSGLYQFTFSAFVAALGGSVADYRITISSNPSLTGDLLSFRNRTYIVDRYHGSGASTVYLTAGQQVYLSVLNNGANYQVGGYIGAVGAGEIRTFLDVRRLE